MCGTSTVNQTQNQATSTNLPSWATSAGQTDYSNASNQVASNPWQGYSGPTTASFGPQTGTASNALTSELGQNNAALTGAQSSVNGLLGSLNPAASTSSYMNPYVSATLAPTLQNLGITQQQQTAQLGGNAAMSGAFGGSNQGVQQALLDNYDQQNVTNATGAAYDNAYSAAQTQQNNVANQVLGGSNALSNIGWQENNNNNAITGQLGTLGAQQQSAGQTGITNAIQLNTQNQTMPLSQQSTLAQILGMSPMDTSGTTNTTGTTTTPDNSGYAMLGSLLSGI